MDENGLNNGEKTVGRDNAGKFIEGTTPGPGRPKGSTNKYTITKLIEAIEAEEEIAKKENAPGLFQMFARMAYINPTVMISLMKKFVADKTSTEITTPEPVEIVIHRAKDES